MFSTLYQKSWNPKTIIVHFRDFFWKFSLVKVTLDYYLNEITHKVDKGSVEKSKKRQSKIDF